MSVAAAAATLEAAAAAFYLLQQLPHSSNGSSISTVRRKHPLQITKRREGWLCSSFMYMSLSSSGVFKTLQSPQIPITCEKESENYVNVTDTKGQPFGSAAGAADPPDATAAAATKGEGVLCQGTSTGIPPSCFLPYVLVSLQVALHQETLRSWRGLWARLHSKTCSNKTQHSSKNSTCNRFFSNSNSSSKTGQISAAIGAPRLLFLIYIHSLTCFGFYSDPPPGAPELCSAGAGEAGHFSSAGGGPCERA